MTNARDLSNRLSELLRREHHAMADFLLALADFDRRRAWEELGHASLFAFLRRELGLSAGAAQYRKTAAELIQRHADVEAALRSGKLCLSSIIELAKVLTPENVTEVLPRFFGLSRREAADVAVSIRPVENRPVREVVSAVRPCPAPPPRALLAPALVPLRPAELDTTVVGPQASPDEHPLRPAELRAANAPAQPPLERTAVARASPPSSTVEPLNADLVRLHLTVPRRVLAKLAAAKEALSHARPGAATEEVLEAALDLLLVTSARRKAGAVKDARTEPTLSRSHDASKPSKPSMAGSAGKAAGNARDAGSAGAVSQHGEPGSPAPRHVPAAVRREVWARDQGRCQWPLDSGGVCGSTHRLELDHVIPVARGGPSTAGNVRILCERHNKLAARRTFGEAWMARFERGRDAPTPNARVDAKSAP